MGEIIKTIFGGGSSETQSTSTPVDMTPDAFKNLRDPFAEALRSLLQQGGPKGYEGPLTSPIGQNEQDVLNYLQANTGGGSAARGLLDKTLQGDFLPGGANQNPFLDAVIRAAQRPTLEGLTETLGRTLPGRFTNAGQFIQANNANSGGSSAFDRAAAIATRGAANTLGDIATNIGSNAYTSERQLQQGAVTLNQAEVDTTLKNLQAQALPRLIQEHGIDRGMQLFQQQTAALLQLLQTIGGVTAPAIANQGQSSGSQETWKGIFPSLFPKGL